MGKVSDFLNARLGSEAPQKIGIAGFTMLARVRESYKYSSEVPTTYLEDGSSVEDHIILNPIQLSIEGEVADIFVEETPLQALSGSVSTAVGSISVYLPERTQTQRQAVAGIVADVNDAINAADELIRAGGNVASLFGASKSEGKPITEQFVDTMEALHFGRQVVQIEMPLRTFSNMRITCDISRDNQKKALSFKIEAVEVRVADEAVSEVAPLVRNPSPGIGGQAEGQTDKGVQEGAQQETSLLGTILGLGG